MAARVGGDEFVVVLDDLLQADDVFAVAQRLLDVLSTPYGVGALQLTFRFQHGNPAGGTMRMMMRKARCKRSYVAMSEAKRSGGAKFCVFEHAMQERAARRGEIEIWITSRPRRA